MPMWEGLQEAQDGKVMNYRTRDVASAVEQSPRTVQRYLDEKYPGHEGWHSFTWEQFEALVNEIKTSIPTRRANQRRACFRAKNRL